VSVVYEPWENQIFRASVARAFRNPSFIESFLDLVIVEPPVIISSKGDTDLEAEEITSFEVGYQTRMFSNRLEFKIDTFYNILDEIIEFERVEPPPDIHLRYFNAGKATAYGGEIGLTYRMSSWLSTYCNYSYQKLEARDDEVQSQLIEKGEDIKSSPRHKVNAGLYAGFENGLNGSLQFNYVSEETFGFLDSAFGFEPTEVELDAYTRVDTRIGYKFPNRDIEASLIIENALNDEHREFPLGENLKRLVLFQIYGRF
jgi:iron complex outermembrane receptor protein